MGKRQLLFVTYGDENLEEGVSYAIELAKAMYEDITLLIVRKKNTIMDKLGTIMTAVSFAEEGELDAARDIVAGNPESSRRRYEQLLAELKSKCLAEGITLGIQETEHDAVSGIRTYLKGHTGIDKVVLSPAVTGSETVSAKDLNRLVRTASRPIVTMTKQACGVAC